MLGKNRMRQAQHEGFRQGMITTLLISSPFIWAGVKWMMENAEPVRNRMNSLKESDVYTQLFNHSAHSEKQANRKLQQFRAGEGQYSKDSDVEVSEEEDEQLFSMIKQIVKSEISKTNEE